MIPVYLSARRAAQLRLISLPRRRLDEQFAMGPVGPPPWRRPGWRRPGLPAGLARPPRQSGPSGPMVKLITAQKSINVPEVRQECLHRPRHLRRRRRLGAAVRRAARELRDGHHHHPDHQRSQRPGHAAAASRRRFEGWQGLHRFLRITIATRPARSSASQLGPFCPDGFCPALRPERAGEVALPAGVPVRSVPARAMRGAFSAAGALTRRRHIGRSSPLGKYKVTVTSPAVAAVPASDAACRDRHGHGQGGQAHAVRTFLPADSLRYTGTAPGRPLPANPPTSGAQQPARLVASRPVAAAVMGHQDQHFRGTNPIDAGGIRRHGLERRPCPGSTSRDSGRTARRS